MIKRKLLIILLCLSMLVCSSGFVYGMTTTSVINEFETGIVDVELDEYQKVGDMEEPWVDNPTILPGDVVSKIPRIDNPGNDCYVRVKITFRDTDQLDEDDLFGISDKWVKADDGYWYYTEILPHGETVDIFEGLIIPDNFDQKDAGGKFFIDIDVDAIQSKNFEPDFELANPWGNVDILECDKEGQYDVSTFKPSDSKSFEIVYEGEVSELIKNEDDFFTNFPYLMPGDEYKDFVVFENESDDDIIIYFNTESVDDSELLDKIQLKITTAIDGKTVLVYEGSLRADDLNEKIALGMLPAGATGKFDFEIVVPPELNNKYTIMSSEVKWVFSTELKDAPSDDPTDPSNPSDPTEPSEPSDPSDPSNPTDPDDPTEPSEPDDNDDPKVPANPQTGDMSATMIWICFYGFFFSGIGLIIMFIMGRKEREYV